MATATWTRIDVPALRSSVANPAGIKLLVELEVDVVVLIGFVVIARDLVSIRLDAVRAVVVLSSSSSSWSSTSSLSSSCRVLVVVIAVVIVVVVAASSGFVGIKLGLVSIRLDVVVVVVAVIVLVAVVPAIIVIVVVVAVKVVVIAVVVVVVVVVVCMQQTHLWFAEQSVAPAALAGGVLKNKLCACPSWCQHPSGRTSSD